MVRKRHLDAFGRITVVTKKNKRVTGMDAFKVAINRKQIPLCTYHHDKLHKRELKFGGLDWE